MGAAGTDLTGRVVLIVEDHDETRELLVALIESAGGRAVAAPSAQHAIQVLTGVRVDAVVTDYAMPVTTGLAFLEQLREKPAHATLPVLMMSGQADAGVIREVARLRAAFIPKPADPDLVIATLARLLERSSAA